MALLRFDSDPDPFTPFLSLQEELERFMEIQRSRGHRTSALTRRSTFRLSRRAP
jgi:hypothetical protein